MSILYICDACQAALEDDQKIHTFIIGSRKYNLSLRVAVQIQNKTQKEKVKRTNICRECAAEILLNCKVGNESYLVKPDSKTLPEKIEATGDEPKDKEEN
jgi:hypothetical protein